MTYNASLTRFHQAKNILHNAKINLLLNLGEELSEEKLKQLRLSVDFLLLYTKMTSDLLINH